MAAAPDTGEPPLPGPAYDLGNLLVLAPLRSPTGPRGWTRMTLGDDRVVTIQSAALQVVPYSDRFANTEGISSWINAVPLPGSGAERTSGFGDTWSPTAYIRLGWNREREHRWELALSLFVGFDQLEFVNMLCEPAPERRLHCWWFGEGAAGPYREWPGELALHPNSHFWWTRYDHPDEVPQPTQAQALELYLLGGLGQ
jgi:hypothetical protein